MKIGILTFHRAHNYGAVLQAFALKSFLENKGYEVEIIDYRQPLIERSFSLFKVDTNCSFYATLRSLISSIIYWRFKWNRKRKFELFQKRYLSLSGKKVMVKDDIPVCYDIYIHGSDQVWNPKLVGNDAIYWGNYEIKKDSKRMTYAASFESDSIAKMEVDRLTSDLNNFKFISLREAKLIDLLQPFSDKLIYNVLDPTLLVDSFIWDKMLVRPKIEKKYVLVYQVGQNKNTIPLAKNIADQINARVIVVSAFIRKSNIYRNNPSPEELVGYFKHAACIVSTSFHATTFSLIFRRPFYTVAMGTGSDVRYTSLLASLGLENRIIYSDDKPTFTEISYDEIFPKLEELRSNSLKYINKAIASE